MDKIVGISGAHGAGKTSILTELAKRGYTVDDFKVSRHVQKERGWSNLNESLASFQTMYEFQIDILKAKRNRDLQLKQEGQGSIILTERTFLDVYAYTAYWTWEFCSFASPTSMLNDPISFDTATRFLMWFRNECEKAQAEIYSGVCLLPLMPHIPHENDPHRASRAVSPTMVYETMDVLSKAMNHPKIQVPVLELSADTIDERADQVEQFLRGL